MNKSQYKSAEFYYVKIQILVSDFKSQHTQATVTDVLWDKRNQFTKCIHKQNETVKTYQHKNISSYPLWKLWLLRRPAQQ